MTTLGRAPLMRTFFRGPGLVVSRGMAAGRAPPKQPPFPWRSDMLDGKHAIVTGGSAGIGAAITEALVRAGEREREREREQHGIARTCVPVCRLRSLWLTTSNVRDSYCFCRTQRGVPRRKPEPCLVLVPITSPGRWEVADGSKLFSFLCRSEFDQSRTHSSSPE